MIRNNLLSKELLTSPVTRYVGFFAVIFVIAIFDILYGRLMLAPSSLYPFLIMMIVPAGFGLINGWNLIRIIRRSCIPIGIIVCIANWALVFPVLDSYDQVLLQTRLTYAPLALSIVLAFLLPIIETTEKEDIKKSKGSFILAFISVLIAFGLLIEYFSQFDDQLGWSSYLRIDTLIICLVIIFVGFIHPKMVSLKPAEKIYKSSLGIVIFFAIFGVSSYVFGVATDDGIVPFIASMLGILYGAMSSLMSIVAGANLRESDQEAMFYDWHMIESYAFYVLIVLPPPSMLEMIGSGGYYLE